MVQSMPTQKELEKIGNLINSASGLDKSFFNQCSETKFLAMKNYYRAEDEYLKLASKALSAKDLGIAGKGDCYRCLSSAKSALESGQLDNDLIAALESLRSTYLERKLRPAFREYIQNETANNQPLKKLYTNALKIDSLIEVIQFMNKVQPMDE